MKKFLTLILVSSFFSSTSRIVSIDYSNNINQNSEATYTVNFYNDEFTLLSSKKYAFGETPIPPSTPSKENPLPEYNYTFNGWAPSISIVTDDIDYVATYKTEVTKTGKVIWVDGDGEILATDTYAYGTMPHYQGSIPTKTPTATEKFVFKGWGTVSPVLAEETTYVAQFDPIPIPPISKYSIRIACENCLVNKKKEIIEEYNPNTPLSYQFSNTSASTYHYPYSLNVKVDGEVSNDYTYDNLTGKLDITLTGNTEIEAIADNSCVLMKYEYSADHPTVEITCDGDFEYVNWGDGSPIDTNKSHTYSYSSEINQYDIRIYGKLNSIGTTSKAVASVNIFHSVTSIGWSAFSTCDSLTSIIIPNSVVSIGDYAFYKCYSLTSIIIPSSVVSIGADAFSYCSLLEMFDLSNLDHVIKIGVIYDTIFTHVPTIKVKASLEEEYKADSSWSQYADKIIGV